MLNVPVSSLLKLQLPRLFFTCFVEFSHFEFASVPTGIVENEFKLQNMVQTVTNQFVPCSTGA